MNIKKLVYTAFTSFVFGLAAAPVKATPTNLVSSGDVFQYSTLTTDLWTHWAAASLADFASNNGVWQSGQTAFSNTGGATFWAADTDLALQKTFNFNGAVNGSLNLHVASDNGFLIYLNGQLLAKENAEGFTSYWEYNYALNPAALVQGANLLQVLAEDHGGLAYFDTQLDADVVNNVPEPGLLALLGIGLTGMIPVRTRKNRSRQAEK